MRCSNGGVIFVVLLSLVPCWNTSPEMRIVNWGGGGIEQSEVFETQPETHSYNPNDRFYPPQLSGEGSERPLTVELATGSPLNAQPGSRATLTFSVGNNSPEPYALQVIVNDDKGFIAYVSPLALQLDRGGTADIQVVVQVPPTVQVGVQDRIQVTVRTSNDPSRFAVMASRAVLFSIGSQLFTGDDTSPTCNYRFLSDCSGYTSSQYCSQRVWSVSVTMQDDESGLRTMYSRPPGLQLSVPLEVGTNNDVTGTYRASCCSPRVHVQGTDVQGNAASCIIDVTGIQLGTGEIVGIVLGCVIVLILIILLIVCLIRRRRTRKEEPVTVRERSHL